MSVVKKGLMFKRPTVRSSYLQIGARRQVIFTDSYSQIGAFKIGALKNLAIFTGKQLSRSLFLIKLQAFRTVTLLNRDSDTGVFI